MTIGTKEWAEKNVNIAAGCPNGCRYCYARWNAVVRFKTVTAEDWVAAKINPHAVDKPRTRKVHGGIMFPSSHDITPEIINEYCCVLRKLLDAGNEVLIVSKPRLECIRRICEDFDGYKKQILFRFTIGSTNDAVLKFWEPEAPTFGERVDCLKYVCENRFKTSVSCEPYLDAFVEYVYEICRDWITDSFWVGKMNHVEQANLAGVTTEEMEKYVAPMRALYNETVMRSIYEAMKDLPRVRWKDSFRDIIAAATA